MSTTSTERTGSRHFSHGLENTFANLIRISAFIPRNVKSRHDKEIRRAELEPCCNVAGRITLDRRNGSSVSS